MATGMNEALCKFCRSIFEGPVAPDASKTGLAIIRFPHHRCLRELQLCAQAECLLCAGILDEVPEATQARWFAADEAARRERGDGCSEMQLHLDVQDLFSSLGLRLIYPPTAPVPSPPGTLELKPYGYCAFSPVTAANSLPCLTRRGSSR